MPKEPSPPATKEDIQLLMNEIGKLYEANKTWKKEIVEHVGQWKTEIKQHFDVVAENIRHDLVGMHKDRIENHEDRIRRLERHAGVAA